MIGAGEITLGMQISCVEREIRMRREVYGKAVNGGTMAARTAELQIAAMEAVLGTLQTLHDAQVAMR